MSFVRVGIDAGSVYEGAGHLSPSRSLAPEPVNYISPSGRIAGWAPARPARVLSGCPTAGRAERGAGGAGGGGLRNLHPCRKSISGREISAEGGDPLMQDSLPLA